VKEEIDMKRMLSRRFLGTIVALALVSVPALLLKSRTAEAFTLANLILSYDPLAVPKDHHLRVHMVNQYGQNAVVVQPMLWTPTLGPRTLLRGTIVTLQPGEGTEEAFPFANLSPPAGADRVAVVAEVWLSFGPGLTPIQVRDWSAEVASSIEVVDDNTGHQIAVLGGRHVVVPPRIFGLPLDFCLFCN
jgi:hypothetical protein